MPLQSTNACSQSQKEKKEVRKAYINEDRLKHNIMPKEVFFWFFKYVIFLCSLPQGWQLKCMNLEFWHHGLWPQKKKKIKNWSPWSWNHKLVCPTTMLPKSIPIQKCTNELKWVQQSSSFFLLFLKGHKWGFFSTNFTLFYLLFILENIVMSFERNCEKG